MWMSPLRKAPRHFIRHTATTHWTATSMCAARQTFTLRWRDVYKRQSELQTKYNNDKNMFVVEMLYYGYFGEGHNINMDTLETKGYWSSSRCV